jgi:hypothetical protein
MASNLAVISGRESNRKSRLTSVCLLVTHGTKSYQILGCVIAEAATRLDVMDLEIFRSSAELTTPAVPLQNSTAELAISFGRELQARSFGSKSTQGFT